MNLNFHENNRLLYGVVFFGFILLTVIIAVMPAVWVQRNNMPLPGSIALTQQQERGLRIYVSEGCLYCHTQQVRPLAEDAVFGRPSAPGDYARLKPTDIWLMTPELTQTERTGPDLSNVGERQPSDIWQYMHLYNPRAVSEYSVMQSYPWLFEIRTDPEPDDIVVPVPPEYAPKRGKVVATSDAKDLVAYLLSLRQVPLPGIETEKAQPSSSGRTEAGPGAHVYSSHCASCHQSNGTGVSGAFPPLKGDPVVTDKDPTRHIEIVLFGIKGKTIGDVSYAAGMPAWGDQLSDKEVAGVVNHERTSWGNNAPTVTSLEVARIRHRKGADES
jgi:cytochrome c oxidase cbb3-type subunit 2